MNFERFIGINDVPGPYGIVKNINEGIVCRININYLENKKYTWGNSCITFLDNLKMDAFGEGYYEIINKQNIKATFGGREHNIIFNEDYTSFSSTRIGDSQIVIGQIM